MPTTRSWLTCIGSRSASTTSTTWSGREEAEARLARWQGLIAPEYEPFFKELLSSLRNWHDGIFAYFEHPYTNAYVEGVNRLLDDLQRAGRGYSFDAIRAKALLAFGHQHVSTPEFIRDALANKVSQFKPGSLPQVHYGTNIEGLRGSLAGSLSRSRWDGERYVTEMLPMGVSTLKVIGLETNDEPISTQLSE